MDTTRDTLRIFEIDLELNAFLLDRRARGLSPRTIDYYAEKLDILRRYLDGLGITDVDDITAPMLRSFFVTVAQTHNPGGVHAIHRAIKAFLRWFESDAAPDNWRNPIAKVRAPKVPDDLLEPASLDAIRAMLDTCKSRSFHDTRDSAILLCLLDTGCRASEFVAINYGDLDLRTGAILIRHGKGGKSRAVFVGNKARRAIVRFLRFQRSTSNTDPLWHTQEGSRLTYTGLRDVIRRRAKIAQVPAPTLHSFRRAFALWAHRAGCDIVTLQRLMGHSSTAVLARYLKQDQEDLSRVHTATSPVDRSL